MLKIIASGLIKMLVSALPILVAINANAEETRTVEVWKSPTCGCCGGWVEHMRAAGFEVQVHETEDVSQIKSMNKIPEDLMSCHTAKIGGYIIEGHVPASDVMTLLRKKPGIKGLAAPGMPLGSPGMEVPSGEKDAYDVISFDGDGKTAVFASHN